MSKEWFILQFKANSHLQAAQNLNQQGFETFLPSYNLTSRKTSRFISTTKPLFPGYMVVRFDKIKSDWHKINYTHGVSRLITFNSIVKSVPTIVIDNLMIRYDSSGVLLPLNKLEKGNQVKILNGPFTSFIATIETYDTDQRIWVLMDLMGRQTKLQTSADSLQLVN